jgi:hypothetical protein
MKSIPRQPSLWSMAFQQRICSRGAIADGWRLLYVHPLAVVVMLLSYGVTFFAYSALTH